MLIYLYILISEEEVRPVQVYKFWKGLAEMKVKENGWDEFVQYNPEC